MSISEEQPKTEEPKIKVQDPKTFDFECDFGRIERLVDETVDKLHFAMTVPKLVGNDYELVKAHLKDGELKRVQQGFDKHLPKENLWLYKSNKHHVALQNLRSVKKIERYFNTYISRNENVPQRDEYDVNDALNLLYSSKEIRTMSRIHREEISEAAFNFLQDIKLFFYSLLDKMKLSPQQAESREAYLRKMYKMYKEKTDQAYVLQEEALEEVKSTDEVLKEKLDQVLEVRGNIDSMVSELKEYIATSEREAAEKMIYDWKLSEYNRECLKEKVTRGMADLETIQRKNIMEEKLLRTRRIKIEQHLLLVLEQYDRDMQGKQDELDDRQRQVVAEKELLEELSKDFEYQDGIYQLAMKEKEEYMAKQIQEKLKEIKLNASARKAQKYYKYYKNLVRIAMRKGLLKSKRVKKSTTLLKLVSSQE